MRTLTSRAVCVAILLATSGLVSPAGQSRLPEPCTVPDLFLAIARGAAIPAGVEFLAEPCERDRRMPDPTDYSALLGLELADAFDRVVVMDSRYRWAEDNGVAVLRPVLAWSDRGHFLHEPVSAFAFEQQNLVGALIAIKLAMGQDVSAMREMIEQSAPDGQRTFSVKTGATSAVGLLDAVVRAHGGMQWRISYCRPEAAREFVELALTTADGGGVMSRATYPRAANATARNCQTPDPVPAREPVTARVIDTNMLIRLPHAPCAVPSTAGAIGKATGIPVGAEDLDEPCLWDRHQSDSNQTPIMR